MDPRYSDYRPAIFLHDRRFAGVGHSAGVDDGPLRMDTSPSVVDDKPPADLQGEGLSFERDIQPLSKKYFSQAFGSIRNPHRAAAVFAQANAGLKSAYVGNAQIRALDEQSRNRRVQYESTVYALESAREKARKEREMLTNLGPLQSELDSVLGLPDADEQRKELGRLGIRHAGLLANNPAANAAFNAARTGVVDREKGFTVANFVNARGPSAYLKEVERRLGRKLTATDPLDITEAAEWIEKDRLTDAETKAKEIARRKAVEDDAAGIEKALDHTDKIKFLKDKVQDIETDNLDPADEGVLDTVITRFASPEEQKAATTARAKAALVKKIRAERLMDKARRPLKPLPVDPRTRTSSSFR